ncbi:GGDEF domain-containing protein [Tissierella creatinophila]|nr:GGDEF domain-containing protein [Tissierella creatinophila]
MNITNEFDPLREGIILDGAWKIALEDSISFKEKEFNDSNWKEEEFIYKNVLIKKEVEKLDKTIWVRKNVVIPQELLSQDLMLYIPRLPNYHKVYFNGFLIGKTISSPEDLFNDWNRKYGYFIPKNLIQYGKENTISIKTYSSYEYGPSKSLTIERAKDVLKRINIYSSSYTYMYLTNMIILLGMSAYFYFIFTRMKKKKYSYFATLCFVTAIYYIDYFVSTLPIPYIVFKKIVLSCMFFVPILGVLFLREFLSLPIYKAQKINIYIRIMIIALGVILFKDTISYYKFRRYYMIIFTLDYMYIFFMVLWDYFKNHTKKKWIYPLLLIILLMCGHDICNALRGIFPPLGFHLNIYALMIFIGIVALDLAKEYIDIFTKAGKDGLTGLFTQSYFKNELIEIVKDKDIIKKPFSLMMLDIDKFKTFNDNYGHLIGDEVLKIVSRIIKETSPENAIVTRYGGEEFGIILKGYDEKESLVLGEKIRKNIEEFRLKIDENSSTNTTISIGITTFDPKRILIHSEMLIEEADKALYYSKENGRNKVTHHREMRYKR